MAKIITARFRNAGIPQTGLTPTINVYNVTDTTSTLVVGGDPMVEIGDGWYKYVFTTFDPKLEYIYDADGGPSISSPYERYQEGACCAAEPEEVSEAVWTDDHTSYVDINTMGGRHNATFTNVGQLLLDVAQVQTLVELLLKFHRNRTRIDATAKTLTIYDDDETTPLHVFTLRDQTGTPSTDEVCERDPV